MVAPVGMAAMAAMMVVAGEPRTGNDYDRCKGNECVADSPDPNTFGSRC